jgi:hypothetical protein
MTWKPLLLLIKVCHCACAVVGNFIAAVANLMFLAIAIKSSSSSSSIGMQSRAVHGRAVARNSSYCEAPTLRSNASMSDLFLSMANLRGVSPPLQAGGWVESMRIIQNKISKIRSKAKKQNTTQNKQQIQNINAHLFFASTSALPAISSSHTARWPL